MNGGVGVFSLCLLNDLSLSRGRNHSALTAFMLRSEASACARFNEYLIVCHRFSFLE